MRIPNSFLAEFKSSSDLKLTCVFYGLIHKNTPKNLMGYVVTVKQETLAKLCGCSLATVKRSLTSLRNMGFIKSQKRTHIAANRLGTYTYTIDVIQTQKNYFNIDRRLLSRVSGQAFRVYAAFCKLSDSRTRDFYQSLNDLSEILSISKNELLKAIKKLVSLKLIRKRRKKTIAGDYTDNTYIVCKYEINSRIYKKRPMKRAAIPVTRLPLSAFLSTNKLIAVIIIHDKCNFVKPFGIKNFKVRRKAFFIRTRGSIKNELSLTDPPDIIICQRTKDIKIIRV